MNFVSQIGRLTADPQMNYTQSGSAVVKFTIAVNKYYKDSAGNKQEKTSFFNCTAWGKTGELVTQYVKKGHRIAIQGELEQNTWENEGVKKSAVGINVKEVMFLEGKNV